MVTVPWLTKWTAGVKLAASWIVNWPVGAHGGELGQGIGFIDIGVNVRGRTVEQDVGRVRRDGLSQEPERAASRLPGTAGQRAFREISIVLDRDRAPCAGEDRAGVLQSDQAEIAAGRALRQAGVGPARAFDGQRVPGGVDGPLVVEARARRRRRSCRHCR